MNMDVINAAIDRLKKAADEGFAAWPAMKFTKVSGPGPDELTLNSAGMFPDLVVEPGTDLVLKTQLEFNDSIAGISIHGDMLDVTVMSLYPFEMTYGGRQIFKDTGVPVAAGPVFKVVVPHIRKGDNGELTFTLHIPDYQTTEWLYITFSTPMLRARQELLDTAWAELTFAKALAETEDEFTMLEKAVAHVPEDVRKFSGRSMMLMELEMYDMKKKVKDYKVHVIGHSHIDMNWLWTWPDTFNVILRDFKSVLDMMDDYPEMTFTHSQPATYEVVREHAPELFARVQERIKEGRWEPATITWVEGDTNMASGEAMARQMLEAGVFTADRLNAKASTFLMPDTFGHAGNLPQLAISAGAKRYYHHRANPGHENMYPAYWWQGQDGSRLLAISTPSYNGGIHARDLVNAALTGKKFNFNESVHFHGIGDHGGGPARHNMDALQRFQTAPLLPFAVCSTLENYTNKLLESGVEIPEAKGESDFIFEGCYTTHGDIKRENRAGENMLSTADTLTALAGLDKREQLNQAWRTVCFNQFHDIFDGSGIHEVYADSTADFESVSASAQQIVGEALSALHSGLEKGAIAVTNPLGWEQSAWVDFSMTEFGDREGSTGIVGSHGQETVGQYNEGKLGFVAKVPAYSTVAYSLTANTEESELKYSEAFAPTDSRNVTFLAEQNEIPPYYHVETPYFSVYLRKDSGILTSFVDKREGRELVAYGMRRAADYFDTARPDLALNVLQIEEEHPHPMSAWHLDEVHTTHSLLRGAETRVIESGPARIVFEVTHKVRSSTIVQQIIFYRDLARVDFIADVDWQEPGNDEVGVPNLKAAFTASLMECQAWFETPFAAVQRPANGQERPALRWADMGGVDYGIAVLNDSKHGYDILGNRVRLTLVRSGYNPDKIADIGQHTIRYSFVPHAGDWRKAEIVRQGIGFNQSLLVSMTSGLSGKKDLPWIPAVEGDRNIVPSIFKRTRKGEGRIFRLYESTGADGAVLIGNLPEGAKVYEANLLEEPQNELKVEVGKVKVNFTAWQVKTLLIQ